MIWIFKIELLFLIIYKLPANLKAIDSITLNEYSDIMHLAEACK